MGLHSRTRYAQVTRNDIPRDDIRPHPGAPAMPREIGDHYFNRLFPDQSDANAPINRASAEPAQDAGYEYKTVRIPGAKASPRRHASALTALSKDGWELVNLQPRGVLQFGTKDTVTVRRKR